jgi:hypothetical protein
MPEHPAGPVRVYLSTVAGDADAERELLAREVIPELAKRAARLGITIALIDPQTDPAPGEEGWDLPHRLDAIHSSMLFVAVLGERYGEPPHEAIPPELLARHSWLGERSTIELEIRYEIESLGPGSRSFFYLRDPEEPEPAARLADLKDFVRASGRPVFDGYPGLEAFASRVLADLWTAILEETGEQSFSIGPEPAGAEPPASEEPGQPPDKPLSLHEDVCFTVYRPRVVAPLEWVPLVVFAHLDELSSELSQEDREAIRQIEEQAREAFADVPQGFSDESEDSAVAIPDEAEITFVPDIPGVRFNPPRATFLWLEALHREDFRLQASAALDGKVARGRLSVFMGKILLAELNLKIQVDRRLAAVPGALPPEREDARPYHDIFASYSHKDTAIVEEFERYIRALGDRYLIDRETLRAGEVWDDRLRGMIRQADVFQLFWSRNAMQSTFVEQEWRYALSLGRESFIRPVFWEDPLPELPERGLPPEELRRLHFQRFGGSPPAIEKAAAGVGSATAASAALPQTPPQHQAAPPPQAAPPQQRRGRKMLWIGSAAALFVAFIALPIFFMQSAEPPMMSSPSNAPPPIPPPSTTPLAPTVSLTLGSEVDAAGEIPVEAQSEEFAPGQPVIAAVPVDSLPAGTQVQVRWIAPDGSVAAEGPQTVAAGPDHLTFRLSRRLPPGAYAAEVVIDGRQVASRSFAVKR